MIVMHRLPGLHRLATSIHVGRTDLRGVPIRRVQTKRHGRVLFSGMWYGNGRSHHSYGKIEGMRGQTMAFPVGRLPRVVTAYLRRRLT